MTTLTHLECSRCAKKFDAREIHNLCECGGSLLARYDLDNARLGWSREWLGNAPPSMWRYTPLLPVMDPGSVVSLGEGMTPLVRARRLGAILGASDLWVKDDGVNPTGSFKARGLSCAISKAVELGIRKVVMPSAGNAGGALAAYAAAAGIEAQVFMPRDVPQANFIECAASGAKVTLVDGLISDCAKQAAALVASEGWFDMSTLKEPYRLEGKKTMGFEIAEQFRWELPDTILCPVGGGVALIGMWKAFDEMEAVGWITGKRPRMVAVQAAGCQPVVEAFRKGEDRCRFWEDASTLASGLRVPKPLADRLILNVLRASNGTAVAINDQDTLDAGIELAGAEGIFAAPEGATCVAALRRMLADGFVRPDERIVICNTGSGQKYPEVYSTRFQRCTASEQDKLGGLITPR